MKIKTNNKFRNLLYWNELTSKEQKEFDWMQNPGKKVSSGMGVGFSLSVKQ
jgi:hypothetical protein